MEESHIRRTLALPQQIVDNASSRVTLGPPAALVNLLDQLTSFPVPLTSLVLGLVGLSLEDVTELKNTRVLATPITETSRLAFQKVTWAILMLEQLLAQHYEATDKHPRKPRYLLAFHVLRHVFIQLSYSFLTVSLPLLSIHYLK